MKADTRSTFPRWRSGLASETPVEVLANIEKAIAPYLGPADDDLSYEPNVEIFEFAA